MEELDEADFVDEDGEVRVFVSGFTKMPIELAYSVEEEDTADGLFVHLDTVVEFYIEPRPK